jgi:hypothetical protein
MGQGLTGVRGDPLESLNAFLRRNVSKDGSMGRGGFSLPI